MLCIVVTIRYIFCYKNLFVFNLWLSLGIKLKPTMKRNLYIPLFLLSLFTSLTSCFSDLDDEVIPASSEEINDFIYKGLNQFYLYKPDVPQLANNYFNDNASYRTFLEGEANPIQFFESLLSNRDRFSFIVSDFRALENSFNNISLTTGMEFGLVRISGTSRVFGYVRYVLPNTPAANKGVARGMLFDRINGIDLSEDNYQELLNQDSYSIGLAEVKQGQLERLDQQIELNMIEYTENPVFINKVINSGQTPVGYLMYNGFVTSFENELNAAFADFKAANIQELVIDLRYNPGGSIEMCNDLASMITGQFNQELFITQRYNSNFEDVPRFFNNKLSNDASINSLNLNQVYVLTTSNSASASELLISGLKPYINVIQIGDSTRGKFEGSVTLYDSDNYARNGSNLSINHSYAMQPLVLKSINKKGFTDYFDGIEPQLLIEEDFGNLGVLGNEQEPLLKAALNAISGVGKPTPTVREFDVKHLYNSNQKLNYYNKMFIGAQELP